MNVTRERRKAERRCQWCGGQDERTLNGLCMCGPCAEKAHRAYLRRREEHPEIFAQKNAEKNEWRRQLRAQHLCIECKAEDAFTLGGRPKCAKCAAKDAARMASMDKQRKKELQRAYRQKRVAEHRCEYCGKPLPYGYTYKTCHICRNKSNRNHEELRRNRGVNKRGTPGLCWQCVKRPVMEGKKLCEECYRMKLPLILKAAEKAHSNNKNHVWRKSWK